MHTLDVSTISDRIALQAPYFGFLELDRQSAVAVRGIFAPEHQIGHERGPVAGELVRHLATLGSCAAVLEGSAAPAYYLGTQRPSEAVAQYAVTRGARRVLKRAPKFLNPFNHERA